MATHSSILAREIPWTEDPGRLQSKGSQGVRHGSATKQHIYTCVCVFIDFLLHPCGTCNPSSLIRDQTYAPRAGRMES